MIKLGVKQTLALMSLLGMAGLWVLMPELAKGQVTPGGVIAQSDELAEAERLNEQVLQLYNQGKYSEAIPLAERALAIRRKVLGKDIPFEALVDENKHYLVENYSFTYLTSGRDLLRLQNPSPSKQPPVVLADPYFDRPGEVATASSNSNNTRSIDLSKITFYPLLGTAAEARAIASLLNINPC